MYILRVNKEEYLMNDGSSLVCHSQKAHILCSPRTKCDFSCDPVLFSLLINNPHIEPSVYCSGVYGDERQ